MKKLFAMLFVGVFALMLTTVPVLAQTTIDDGDDMDINIDAEILAPTFTYNEVDPLSFGSFYASSAAADVTIDHADTWAQSGNYVKADGDVTATGDHSRAVYDLSGVNGMTFTMTFLATSDVTDGTTVIPVTGITAEFDDASGGGFAAYASAASVTMDAGVQVAFAGVLEVPGAVTYGVYAGTLAVTMDYE